MIKKIKQKKQDLGIFYTDQRIADFIFDILKIWKEKEEKESSRWESRKHFPSVIDPAVGEGVFLKMAIKTGFTKTDYIFGLDIDEGVVKKWKQINLLKEFGGKEEDLEAHFFHQNGLDKIHWEQHKNKYRYKLKQKDISAQQFDAVVGNPPYGGIGVDFQGKLTFENRKLLDALEKFEIFGFRKYSQKSNKEKETIKAGLFDSLKEKSPISYRLSITEVSKIAEGIPIEILFIERFIQLAKPGGWIAIIIPDGILTNSNSHYVREFISEKAKVEAIVSLPRDAFKNVGTTAKTSILFLRKYKDQEKERKDYPVFLASVDSLDEKNFNLVKDNYKNYYNKTMSKKNLVQTTTDGKGREIVMVRVDKTLKEMMEEKPASRWSPGYWHPRFDYWEKKFKELRFSYIPLEDIKNPSNSLIEMHGISSVLSTKRRKGGEFNVISPPVFRLAEFKIHIDENNRFSPCIGLDFLLNVNTISKEDKEFNEKGLTEVNDILFVRKGVGCVKRCTIVVSERYKGHVDNAIFILKARRINPYYLTVYLNTTIGRIFLERLQHGSALKILVNSL